MTEPKQCPTCGSRRKDSRGSIPDHAFGRDPWHKAAVHRWIPVGARLPDKGTEVLIFVTDDMEGHKNFINIGDIGVDGDGDEAWTDGTITHWMPLPDPPELTERPSECQPAPEADPSHWPNCFNCETNLGQPAPEGEKSDEIRAPNMETRL